MENAALHVSQANMGPETGDFFPAAFSMEKVAEVESTLTGKCWVCLTAVYQVVF